MKRLNKLPLWAIVVLALLGVESCKRFVDSSVARASQYHQIKIDTKAIRNTKYVLNTISLLTLYLYFRKMFTKK